MRAKQADTYVRGNGEGATVAEVCGGAYYFWQYVLLPRLSPFLPADCVALVGTGAASLADLPGPNCRRLVVVENLATGMGRFSDTENRPPSWNADLRRQDGILLESVDDDSLDLALAIGEHTLDDPATPAHLLSALASKLRRDGVGFLFHRTAPVDSRRTGGRLRRRLRWPGRKLVGSRTAGCVSARRFGQLADQAQLRCLSQELLAWRSDQLTDCFSVFCRRDARWAREHRVLRNRGFGEEIARVRQLSLAPDTLPLDCRVPLDQSAARFRYVKAA